jgi:hypothetical protein
LDRKENERKRTIGGHGELRSHWSGEGRIAACNADRVNGRLRVVLSQECDHLWEELAELEKRLKSGKTNQGNLKRIG